MRLKTRLLLVLSGVIIFLILTPILILFARGFKIDLRDWQIVKTGSMVVISQPSRASIFLNEKKISKRTPATVRFLLPGDFDVRIEKDGYQSWTKRLSIRPQLVTWANLDREFITLFYQEPKAVEEIKIDGYSFSSDRSRAALVQSNLLFSLNTHNFELRKIGEIKHFDLLNKTVWDSADRLQLVLNNFEKNQSIPDLSAVTKLHINDQFVAAATTKELFVFDYDWQPILNLKQVADFALSDNNLWVADSEGLKTFNLRAKNLERVIPLADLRNLMLLPTPSKLFLIANSSLYGLNADLEKIYDGIDGAYYDSESEKLVFYNKNEILLYNPQELTTMLVHRSISNLSTPQLNNHVGYMFFTNEGKIKAVEMDGRDHRNVYTITEAAVNFTLSKDGKFLYTTTHQEIKVFKIR